MRNGKIGLFALALGMNMAICSAALAAEPAKTPAIPDFMLRGHETEINDVKISPDGKIIATKSTEVIRLWDSSTGKVMGSFAAEKPFSRISFSGDGKIFAAVQQSAGHAYVWDVATQKQKLDIDIKGSGGSLAVSRDGLMIAIGSVDFVQGADNAAAHVYETAGGKEISRFLGVSQGGIAFSNDGAMVAFANSNGKDDNLIVFESKTGNKIWSVKDPNGISSTFAFSPDGKTLVTSGNKSKRWDLATRQEVPFAKPMNDRYQQLTFAADGKALAVAMPLAGGRDFGLIDPATFTFTKKFTIGESPMLKCMEMSVDGTVAAGSLGRTLKIWKLDPNGGEVITTGGKLKTPVSSRMDGNVMVIEGNEDSLNSLAWSPDGSKLYTAGRDFTLRCFDPATGKQIYSAVNTTTFAGGLYMYDGGKRLAFGGVLFDAQTGKREGTVENYNGLSMQKFAVAQNANVAVTNGQGETLALWDLPKLRATKIKWSENPKAICISADGKTVLTMEGETIHVYDAAAGTEKGNFKAPRTNAMAVTPEGKYVALLSDSMILMDVESKAEVAKVKSPLAKSYSLTASPDGKMIYNNGTIFEVPSLKTLGSIQNFDVSSKAAFSPDGQSIAVSQLDRVRVYKIVDLMGK